MRCNGYVHRNLAEKQRAGFCILPVRSVKETDSPLFPTRKPWLSPLRQIQRLRCPARNQSLQSKFCKSSATPRVNDRTGIDRRTLSLALGRRIAGAAFQPGPFQPGPFQPGVIQTGVSFRGICWLSTASCSAWQVENELESINTAPSSDRLCVLQPQPGRWRHRNAPLFQELGLNRLNRNAHSRRAISLSSTPESFSRTAFPNHVFAENIFRILHFRSSFSGH